MCPHLILIRYALMMQPESGIFFRGGMARLARVVDPGCLHHVNQRDNCRQPTFFDNGDYSLCLELGDSVLLSQQAKPIGILSPITWMHSSGGGSNWLALSNKWGRWRFSTDCLICNNGLHKTLGLKCVEINPVDHLNLVFYEN